MKAKSCKEWFLETKFGKLAMISWGDPRHPGVLLVHGYRDTAATFMPLISLLPDTHYYVSFDFPGHGKSDPMPTMMLLSLVFLPQIIREIVNHLEWKSFACVTHSFGYFIATIYHHIYPGQIMKMINMDPMLALIVQYFLVEDTNNFFKSAYEVSFKTKFSSNNKNDMRPYEELVQKTMKSRHLSLEEAKIVLSRLIIPAGDGLYRLAFQPMEHIPVIPTYAETLHYILSHKIPTLNFHGIRTTEGFLEEKLAFALRFMKFEKSNEKHVYVDAYHHLHVTHAAELVPHIVEFLKEDFVAKL